jgi:hypothetical protein
METRLKKFACPGLDPQDFELLRYPLQSSNHSVQTNVGIDKTCVNLL